MNQPDATRMALIASVKTALQEILSSSKPAADSNLTIVVHEFGHTPLYAPVYVVLGELQSACINSDTGESWLKVSYSADETDDKALEKVLNGGAWTPEGCPCLHLGVSEIGEDRSNPKVLGLLAEYPFVKRLPLWGVALAGNPNINLMKQQKIEVDPSMADFWELFAGKLSLLQPKNGDLDAPPGKPWEDFKVSMYGEGSTVHRLFTGYLRAIGQDGLLAPESGRLQFVDFNNEFEPLVKCKVDIAMTVQPWRALRRAREEGKKLELVYTHLAKPTPVSSLYVNRDRKDSADFWPTLMEALGNLVQDAAGDLYECGPQAIDNAFECYRMSAQMLLQDAAPDLEGLDDFTHAIQLLSDSRVFVYKVDGLDARGQVNLERRLERACRAYFDTKAERDPCYSLSESAAVVQEHGFDWHDATKSLESFRNASEQRLHGVVQKFEKLAETWSVNAFKTRDKLDAIRDEWNRRTIDSLFPILTKDNYKGLKFPPNEPWRKNIDVNGRCVKNDDGDSWQVDFSPWFHGSAASEAFRHFSKQFENELGNKLIPKAVRADVLVLSPPGTRSTAMEGLSWVWIEYDINNQDESSNFEEFKFIKLKNERGHQCLNGWWVRLDREIAIKQIFTRTDHGELKLQGSSVTLEHRLSGRPMCIVDRMIGRQGMLFTFRVFGLIY